MNSKLADSGSLESGESGAIGQGSNSVPGAQAAELEQLLSELASRLFVLVPDDPTSCMSINQLRACSILQQGPRVASDLGRELGVSGCSVSQTVKQLVRDGIVERCETKEDRRLRVIKLTERGSNMMVTHREYQIERATNALSRVESMHRSSILGAMQSLIDAATVCVPFRAAAGPEPDSLIHRVREESLKPEKYLNDAANKSTANILS